MSSDCNRKHKSYYRYDWTPSFIEEDYDSDLGSRSTSSTLSWTDDVQEKDAASQLKEHFERFEAALYSETNGDDLTEVERAECNIWKEHFPHLRIIGKKITPINDENENFQPFPPDYEETIAFHSSEPDISECFELMENNKDLKDSVIDKLCETVLPSVMKKIEISLNTVNEIKDLEINGTAYHDKLIKDDFKHQYINKKFPTITLYDQHEKSSRTKLKRVPQSARAAKKKSGPNEYESETSIDKICVTPPKSDRHGILPPIEALAITPKLPSKRATSAMMRFSKTQPRVRPFTTRNKTMYLMPAKNGFVNDIPNVQKHLINPLIEEKNDYDGVYNRRCKLPPRWRY